MPPSEIEFASLQNCISDDDWQAKNRPTPRSRSVTARIGRRLSGLREKRKIQMRGFCRLPFIETINRANFSLQSDPDLANSLTMDGDPKSTLPLSLEAQQLTEEEFRLFADLIYEKAGIFMKDSKLTLLSNRLRRRVKELKLANFIEYHAYLTDSRNQSELEELFNVVTTNETYFYRNMPQFETLIDFVLPEILKQRKSAPVRFFSAGCSSGEEPYNVIIFFIEAMKKYGPFSFFVEAMDLSQDVIDLAKQGVYWGRKVDKIPPAVRKRYFNELGAEKPGGEIRFQVRPDLRNYVRFTQGNLFTDPFPQAQDIIFCRNVMIYFDREHQEALVSRFSASLARPGYLFIGHSESLHTLNTDLAYRKMGPTSVYMKE